MREIGKGMMNNGEGAEVTGEIKERKVEERMRDACRQRGGTQRQNEHRRGLMLAGWYIISAGCMPPFCN